MKQSPVSLFAFNKVVRGLLLVVILVSNGVAPVAARGIDPVGQVPAAKVFGPLYAPDITTGLVAYYPFNGNANDESGHAYDGTVTGSVLTADRFGNPDSAYYFDGASDYIAVNHDAGLNPGTGDFTFSMWIKHPYQASPSSLIQKANGISPWDGISVFMDAPGAGQLDFRNTDGDVNSLFSASTSLNNDAWTHLVTMRQGAELRLYIDGVLDSSKTVSVVDIDTTNLLYFGCNQNDHDYQNFLGVLDDIRYYHRALTVQDIQALYHEGGWNNETPPAAPDNLTAIAGGQTQIDLSWTDNSSNETGFKVERSPAGENSWTLIATTGDDVIAYSDTYRPCNTAYNYRVTARNDDGDSSPSNVATAGTDACTSGGVSFDLFLRGNSILAHSWPLGNTVTLFVDDPGTALSPDFVTSAVSEPAPWNPGGDTAIFYYLDQDVIDLEAGFIVTLTDGTSTKSTVVANLAVSQADVSADTVSGTGSYTLDGRICLNSNACTPDERKATLNILDYTSGLWNVNFIAEGGSDVYDLQPGDEVFLTDIDEDGDATNLQWHVPNPSFYAIVNRNLVRGYDIWPLGTSVTLEIDDPSNGVGVDYTDVQPVQNDPGNPDHIYPEFQLDNFELAPGQIITLTDGDIVKSLVVSDFEVTIINPGIDMVAGTSAPLANISMRISGQNGEQWRTVQADSGGHWQFDFSVPGVGAWGAVEPAFDIRPGDEGTVEDERDLDNDFTALDWRILSPNFSVRANDDRVEVREWPLGATVTLEIDDPGTGANPDYTSTRMMETDDSWQPSRTRASFDLGGIFDIQPGHIISISDGAATKTHTVIDLEIESVDFDNDTFSGHAEPNSRADFWACNGSNCSHRHVDADGDGNWTADFANPGGDGDEQDLIDIMPGSWVDSQQGDSDGDLTQYGLHIPNPSFSARLPENEVHGYEWSLGALVTLTIDDPDNGVSVDFEETKTVEMDDWDPSRTFIRFTMDPFQLEPGQTVVMTDGVMTKTHVVTNLAVTSVDPDADTVSGTAAPDSYVEVGHLCDENGCAIRRINANSEGNWVADFSAPGAGTDDDEQLLFDIRPGTGNEVRQPDEDGDTTTVQWYLSNPNFSARFPDNEIHGYEWPLGASIDLTIDDPDNGAGIDYLDTQVVETADWDPNQTIVFFRLGSFLLEPGQTVTMTDGATTKTHVVQDLSVVLANPETDVVSGTAAPGSYIEVGHLCDESGCAIRRITVGLDGTWLADFSMPGEGPNDDEQMVFDLISGTSSEVRQPDEDGDSTSVQWRAAVPRDIYIKASAAGDWVHAYGWLENNHLTLEVDSSSTGPGVDFTTTTTAGQAPWNPAGPDLVGIFDLAGAHDLLPGDAVTITGGGRTETYTVPAQMTQVRWFVGLGAGTEPGQLEVQEQVVDDFNLAQPGIELILEVQPNDTARDTLLAEIAAGNAPDIVGPVGWAGSNAFYGQWLDLEPLIISTGYDTTQFNPALVNMYQTEEGQVGLPFAVYPGVVYYQKAMFDAAGLHYPPANYGDQYEMPGGNFVEWNYDVIGQIARLLTLDSSGKNATEAGFDPNDIVQYGYFPQWQQHPNRVGSLWGADVLFSGTPGNYTAIIPAQWDAAWKWTYDGMWGAQPFIPTDQARDSGDFGFGNVFASGKVAISITQSWYTCCAEGAGTNWDLAALPAYNGQVHGHVDADTFRVIGNTAHPDEAFTALTYLVGDGAPSLLQIYGAMGARTADQDAFLADKQARYPFVTNWDVVRAGVNYVDTPNAESWMPHYNTAWDRLQAFADYTGSTAGLNMDNEIATLQADLQSIFNYGYIPISRPAYLKASALENRVHAYGWQEGIELSLEVNGVGVPVTASVVQAPWNPTRPDLLAVFDLDGVVDLQPGDVLTVTGDGQTATLTVPAALTRVRWFVGLGSGTEQYQIPVEEQVVDAFNISHPEIELLLEVHPYDTARAVLQAQIDAGNAPDLVGPVGWGGTNSLRGQWLDLDPMILSTGYDTTQFDPALLDANRTEDGQIGLPFMIFPGVVYYQKGLFDAAGLNDPPANYGDQYEMPDGTFVEWNYDVVRQIARLLTLDSGGRNTTQPGFDRNNIVQFGFAPQWQQPAHQASFWGADRLYAGTPGSYTASIPEQWAAAWNWTYDGMWGAQPFIPNGPYSNSPAFGSSNVFNSGNVAMIISQAWYTCCLNEAGENWDLAALPSYDGVVHGRVDADTIRILKDSAHPDQAFEAMTYLIGEATPALMNIYGGMPARLADQDAYFTAKSAQFPWVTNWEIIRAGQNYPDIPSAEGWMPNFDAAWSRLQTFQELMSNEGDLILGNELDTLRSDLELIFNGAPLPPQILETSPVSVAMDEDGSPDPFTLILHASDAEGDLIHWRIAALPAHGTASVSGMGESKSIGYSPTADYFGPDSFVVEVFDVDGVDSITVNVDVTSINDAPMITEGESVAVSIDEDGAPISFDLTLHAGDIDSIWLSWSIQTPASHGIASVIGTGNSKSISYSPEAGFVGDDSFVVQVDDGEGGVDSIIVNVSVGSLWMWVNPGDHFIHGRGLDEGTPVDLTVVRSGETVYTDHTIVAPAPWNSEDILANFPLNDSQFDLLPGDVVTMSGGGITRSMTVADLSVTNADPDTDTVSGTAAPGALVSLWIHGASVFPWPVADGDGYWSGSFSGLYDLVPGTGGGADIIDSNNHRTQASWHVLNPNVSVHPDDDWLEGYDWLANTAVTITIDDPDTTDSPDLTHTVVTGTSDWNASENFFSLDLRGQFDIEAGFLVSVSDGETTKTHMVTNLVVTGVDPENDIVSGMADPFTHIRVDVFTPDGDWLEVDSDADGLWMADFTTQHDIQPGDNGRATEYDEDGDNTGDDWRVPNPNFSVRIPGNRVEGYEWPLGAQVTLTVDGVSRGGTQTVQVADWDPSQTLVRFELGTFQLEPGQTIVMTDGVTTKSHVVTNLAVTTVDPDADTVSGTAAPDSYVEVGHLCDENGCAIRRIYANSEGIWVADFSIPGEGTDNDEQRLFDILPGTGNEARQPDDDGDTTTVEWRVPNPSFSARIPENQVHGYEWPLGTSVTLTIDDPDIAGETDYTDTQTVGRADWDSSQTFVSFDLGAFQLEPGQTVTMTDGITTKTHLVMDLTVTLADPLTDTVSGTADPEVALEVGHLCNEFGCAIRRIVSGLDGSWSADFSVPGAGEGDDEQMLYDLQPGDGNEVRYSDEDGDTTTLQWRVYDPLLLAYVDDDVVLGTDWPLGQDVTLTFDGVDIETQPVEMLNGDPNQTQVRFELNGFDLASGQIVQLSNGTLTKTHTVTGLAISAMDLDAETISGTAEADSQVVLGGNCSMDNCVLRRVTADGGGLWQADFSVPGSDPDEQGRLNLRYGTLGDARQVDDDGDATIAQMRVFRPRPGYVKASPDEDWIYVYGLAENVDITLTVDDPETPEAVDFTTTVVMGQAPWSPADLHDIVGIFDLSGVYDLQVGDELTITDGATTLNYTVVPLTRVRWFVGLGTGTNLDQIEVEKQVMDEFNMTHPGIALILEVVGYDASPAYLEAAFANGTAPDIIGPVGWGGAVRFNGQWMDLEPLIQATSYDTSVFDQSMYDSYKTNVGQEGLPFSLFPTAVYYQKSMFDAAGLNYPPANYGDLYVWPNDSTSVWNYETLAQVGRLLTLDSSGRNATEPGFDRNSVVQYGFIPQWVNSATELGSYWGADQLYQGTPGEYTAVIPDQWAAAWNWYHDGMWGAQSFIPPSYMVNSPQYGNGNAFNSGHIAMAITHSWYTCCISDAGTNWDLAALPSYNGQVHGTMHADSFRLWKGTSHPDAAFEAMTYLVGDGSHTLLDLYGGMPARIADQDSFLVSKADQYPWVENWAIMRAGLQYPDVPNHEGYMPNWTPAWERLQTFRNLMDNDSDLNMAAEIETLRSDLEVIFNGAPRPPQILESGPLSVAMDEDGSPDPFNLILHASDAEADVIHWRVATPPAHGAAMASGTGESKAIGYVPAADYYGPDSFVVEVYNSDGADRITIEVDIQPVNDDPVIAEGQTASVTMSEDGDPMPFGLTLHASDEDGVWLFWYISTPAAHGTAGVNGLGNDKTVSYFPAAGYHGPDSFVVVVADGQGGTDSITVNVAVDAVNDLPVISEGTAVSVTMDEDGSPIPFDLTLHAADPDLDTLTWSVLTPAAHGAASASGTGESKAIGYLPDANYHGSDSFVVQITDGIATDTITVNLNILPVNDLPVIAEGATAPVTMSEDGAPTPFSLTLHAGDADGILLFWYITSPAGHGTAGASGVGNTLVVSYTPAANYHGPDSFIVEAADGQGGTASITVTVDVGSVNDLPEITEGASVSVTLDEDASLSPSGLILHAVDADSDPLVWSVASPAVHGTAAAGGTGDSIDVGYVPAADYHGSDSFVVEVSDGQGGNDTITVEVTVTPVNDAPDGLGLSNASLPGNQLPGTVVGTFTSTDADAGETFIYSLVGGVGDSDNASFAIVGDQLQTAAVLLQGSYSIRVRTTDSGGAFFEQVFLITVTANVYNPVLLAPEDAAELLNNRPVFDWVDVPGAYSYTIQVSRNSAFTQLVLSVTVRTSTYTPTVDLRANSTLYWRVRPNRVPVANAWSEVRTIVTAAPPSVPVLSVPAANALVTDYAPLLDWSNSTVPAGTTFERYQLQVAGDPGFTSLLIDAEVSGIANSTYTPSSDLPSNDTIYWRVRSFNTLGQYSAWSLVRSFRTALLPPVLIAPENPATLLSNRPLFDWEDVAGATGYNLQIARNNTFTTLLPAVNVTISTYMPATDLPANTTLYWRVRATGANGPSGWSDVRTMKMATPPSIPVLAAPAANALVTTYTPTLDWANATVPKAPVGLVFSHYEVQVATSAAFDELVVEADVAGQTNSIYVLEETLPANATYYWRVRSFNTLGQYSSWSATRAFRTPLLPPDLLAPAEADLLTNNRPGFDWEDVDGASGYAIQVSRNVTFTAIVRQANVAVSNYTPPADLPAKTALFWRVRATGANGPGGWSEVRTLTSANPPSVPVLSLPAANALVTGYTPRLDWANSTVPTGVVFRDYQVQVATDAGFTSIVMDEFSTISEYTPETDLPANARLYWRVRSFNTLGQSSTWSVARYFRTRLLPPALLAPEDGVSISVRRPLFDWEDVFGATGYTIQVSTSPVFATFVVNVTVTASTSAYMPAVDLPLGTLYWRVRANGANGPSAWSQWTVAITLP